MEMKNHNQTHWQVINYNQTGSTSYKTRYHIYTSIHTGNSVRCHSSLVMACWTYRNGQKFCHHFR